MWNLVSNTYKEPYESYATAETFSESECSKIVELGKHLGVTPASVGLETIINEDLRRTSISWLTESEETAWIYRRCTDYINNINDTFFKFDLHHIQTLQFSIYNSMNLGFYDKHIDIMSFSEKNSVRKLSFSIQLNNPSDYEGGNLALHISKDPVYIEKKLGNSVFFPSYVLHEVTPVSHGVRYSLVGWVCGPKFR